MSVKRKINVHVPQSSEGNLRDPLQISSGLGVTSTPNFTENTKQFVCRSTVNSKN